MSLHVCLGQIYILDSRLAIFRKKLSFWLSACSILIVVPLLKYFKLFAFGVLERKVLGNFINSIPDHCLLFYFFHMISFPELCFC